MLTYGLMGLLVTAFLTVIALGCRYDPEKKEILSLNDTNVLKGIWCIVVVLVHVPAGQQNKIQDMISSFAYIGVTFFFLASAYGLKKGVESKPGYLTAFWRKRLPKLLIPVLIINLISAGVDYWGARQVPSVIDVVSIDLWVKVLLLYNAAFWCVYYVSGKFKLQGGVWQDIVVCAFVCASSMVAYFVKTENIWPTESWGFIWGILLARYMPNIKKWLYNGWFAKTVAIGVLSLVLGAIYLKYKTVVFLGDYCIKVLLGITITMFILLLSAKFQIGNAVSRFLGAISYEVYLFHTVAFSILNYTGLELWSGIYIWTAIALTLMFAALICRISKKAERPIAKLLK